MSVDETASAMDDKLNALLKDLEVIQQEVTAQLASLKDDIEATLQFFKEQRAS